MDKQKVQQQSESRSDVRFPVKDLNETFRALSSSADILNVAAQKIAALPPSITEHTCDDDATSISNIQNEADESFVSVEEEEAIDEDTPLAEELSRAELVDKLKDNLFAALEYRLVDILNNGSIDEVMIYKVTVLLYHDLCCSFSR